MGYLPVEAQVAGYFFQVVARRYEHGSIIITSNKSFADWGQMLGDSVLVGAVLDRLLPHCTVLVINGPSYRLRDKHKLRHQEVGNGNLTESGAFP